MSNEVQQTATDKGSLGRAHLARLVAVASFLTIFLLVATLVGLAATDAKPEVIEVGKNTFTAILPVVAGWMGTVLAFYFSSQSLDRTSASLDLSMSQNTKTANTSVTKEMIPAGNIIKPMVLAANDDAISKKTAGELLKIFKDSGITRMIFWTENQVCRYILHRATLNDFIVRSEGDLSKTFAQLLEDGESQAQITQVAFVPATASLRDAKAALKRTAGAQDIIVTASGNSSEPVLGWLTNIDLMKALDGA
ncbi:hypothetical protein [Magnetospirillum sp. UT-4]|uniref:hypothetical protein n=1 Tax=Magnetospirillum sp. UT-4 TaxID=2681467 RepID=UPI001383940C|nr:hypothetical protein [Magnetospirillum sp. UT-4]CAA7613203.1 hypothetical protein MTBUT4_130013 [Magnetospirillum sp. UT-4]